MRCAVNDEECVPGRLRRGMCERHYRRWLAHGETTNPRLDNLSHYLVEPDGCWRWQGALWRNGYGKTSLKIHGTRLAHRVLFIEHRGEVADGLDLDHLCRNRWCVNPEHLEPVSRAVNLERGRAARTTCRSGRHDITKPGATRPGAGCVECWRIRYRAAGERYRAKQRS